MANIIEAFNEVFTEEYALAKFFVYAIPVFICLNAYATGQFVLSGFCGFFVILLLFGLLTCGINGMRENKQEVLTFNIQRLAEATIKTAIAMLPQISVAAMIGLFVKELLPVTEELGQIPMIVNWIVWSILISLITTSYLAFTRHLDIKEAYNMKTILESVVDVFVNLVFLGIQLIILNAILVGLMSYIFTLLNLPIMHPGFMFYCSLLVIVNISVIANILSQTAYDCIKGKDDDYKAKYKIGSTLATANFSGGISITSSGAAPFTPGGITTSGSVSNNTQAPNRAAQSRNHLNRNRLGGRSFSNQSPNRPTGTNRNTSIGRTGQVNRNVQGRNINRNIGGSSGGTSSGGSSAGGKSNPPKRTFGNNRRPSSGFGNNRNSNRFGNNKKNKGGGFFK